jgi:diguanylate cyclase (GGDEF)-like protein
MTTTTEARYCSRALDLLNDISGTILEQRDQEDVIETVIENVSETFGARAGSVAVPDENEEYLDYIAGFNREPELIQRLNSSNRLGVNEGVAGHAFTNETIYGVEDVFESNVFEESFHDHARREGFRAILSAPMMAFGNCLGVVSLYYGETRDFDRTLRQTMDSVSNQVAMALLHSNLLEKLEESNEELRRLSETDELTGLLNHRAIRNRLGELFNRARSEGELLSVILADIDHFKKVNDNYGHAVGDRVLKRLGELFFEETRSDDLIGRDGGEEFLIGLPGTGRQEAEDVAKKLRKSVEESSMTHGTQTISITISLGVSTFSGKAGDIDELVHRADEALYEAKNSGRNSAVHATDLMLGSS